MLPICQRYGVGWIIVLFVFFIVVFLSGIFFVWDILSLYYGNKNIPFKMGHIDLAFRGESRTVDPDCRFWNCLNLYRCGQKGHDRLTVYVYPIQDYVDENNKNVEVEISREYYQILDMVKRSSYYSSNPNEACLFLPSIDLLNPSKSRMKQIFMNRALTAMSYWDNGENHLIFNLISDGNTVSKKREELKTDRAIILGGNFDTWTYRPGFDIALPVLPSYYHVDDNFIESIQRKKSLLVVAQTNILPKQSRIMENVEKMHPEDVLYFQACQNFEKSVNGKIRCHNSSSENFEYPKLLKKGKFCLLSRGIRFGQPDLIEMLAHGCIPVVAIDNYVLPFEDVLDWSLFSVRIHESEIYSLVPMLKAFSHKKVYELQRQGRWIYNRYFRSLREIVFTALEILEERIFPHRSRSKALWNYPNEIYAMSRNPLFLTPTPPKIHGFTGVILTYDRVESLFSLIQKLAMVPSLRSLIVIWNNQNKMPPHLSLFPSVSKPIKVIQTRANKLSNRFYPYTEIETEAVLTIDDDINMLTADELDFGYEVWREFPDRIVGFPSRIHVWDNITHSWRYDSEWTNHISMVLTGAAFHHKFWSHMYTYAMPGDIKNWVDEHMNCEDIAMNFLVSKITSKPPIKVTPRKKFKCPECTNTEMLSADLNHMKERSACIDRFARIYGLMPLRSVEFRADPVLFKDIFPEKLKRFNDVGNL